MKKRHAFTLIEMLVVIAIIGIVAALVVNMNAHAQDKKRRAAVAGDKQKLMLMIGNYQSRLNFYPPDNATNATLVVGSNGVTFAQYDGWAATNPLLYELTGATNNPNSTTGKIQTFDTNTITSAAYGAVFGRPYVNNANVDEPHDFFQPGPQPAEYVAYDSVNGIKGLVVPVAVTNNPFIPNFWHYDASSPNRHNMNSYDLWAEFITGNPTGTNIIITTNGNW
jgi:prepilin-type N-terminal cleavage/methylation domain-containing protein